jgi:hypothetical protein
LYFFHFEIEFKKGLSERKRSMILKFEFKGIDTRQILAWGFIGSGKVFTYACSAAK